MSALSMTIAGAAPAVPWRQVGVENGLAGYEAFTEQRIIQRPSRLA
jgi:hypothetical protein